MSNSSQPPAREWINCAQCFGKWRRRSVRATRCFCAIWSDRRRQRCLVMPIDKEAPKGRIKHLQAQSIRELLDGEASCVVVKDAGLEKTLDNLKISAEDCRNRCAGLREGGARYSGFHSAYRVSPFCCRD